MSSEPANNALSAQRVGLFGGAFDPPHRAHVALAEAAMAQLQLDRLLILPTGQAWHKTRPLTEAVHRLAMCELAFADLAGVLIDDRETRREGASYTADTLIELAAECPGAQLFLVLGADQMLAFKSWKRWQEVLAHATLAVAGRPPLEAAARGEALDLSAVDLPFVRLNMPLQNISATAARESAGHAHASATPLAQLVPEAVAGYISRHSLYQKLP